MRILRPKNKENHPKICDPRIARIPIVNKKTYRVPHTDREPFHFTMKNLNLSIGAQPFRPHFLFVRKFFDPKRLVFLRLDSLLGPFPLELKAHCEERD